MGSAETLSIVAAGVFFLTGLLTGVWKYLQISANEEAVAHPYVDIAHRASLLYAFAALLLARFCAISQLPDTVEFWAAFFPLLYFGFAILTYIIHGALRDTDNQLEKPHRLGGMTVSPLSMAVTMWSLVIAEIGGFVVLFYGVLVAVL